MSPSRSQSLIAFQDTEPMVRDMATAAFRRELAEELQRVERLLTGESSADNLYYLFHSFKLPR